jgi:hypothetical protein
MRLDTDGSFELSARAGKYVVSGTAALKSGSKSTASVYQALTVDRDMDDVLISPSQTIDWVKGIVHDEHGRFPGFVNGQGEFALASMVSRWWSQGFRVDQAGVIRGKSDGTNTLITGYVRAMFYGLPPEYFIQSVQFNGTDVTNRTFVLPATGGNFDVTVASGAAEVSGVVRSDKGGEPGDAQVTIWSLVDPPNGTRRFSATTSVNDGTFTFDHLPPGSYAIVAWEGIDEGTAAYPDFYRHFEGSAVRLTLNKAARETASLIAISREIAETHAAKLK